MCQPHKWGWGLLPLALLWLIAMWFKTAPIEADLSQRATAALAATGHTMDGEPWAKVSIDGRDATITGVAPSDAVLAGAPPIVDNTFGVRLVAGAGSVLEAKSPFVWQAAKEAGKITLTGLVAPDGSRRGIVQAARKANPGAEIVDQMTLANGAPEGAEGMSVFALDQLARLTTGTAGYSDTAFSIAGSAPDSATFNSVRQAIRALPAGFRLASDQIVAPTPAVFAWAAEKAAGGLTLTGMVGSEEARTAVVAAARAAAPGATVTDRMEIVSNAPAGAREMQVAGLAQLGRLTTGTASLAGTVYSLVGAAPDVPTFEQVSAAARQAQPGFSVGRVEITAPTARPYVLTAVKEAAGITLTGSVPSEAARASVVAAARRATSGTVTDQTTLALGAPAGFEAMVNTGLGQLGKLSTGRTNLTDTAYSIAGAAPDVPTYDQLLSELRTMPAGFTLASQDITGPTARPYVLTAIKAASGITLTGSVPSETARTSIVAGARRATSGTVTDQTTLALGAPAGFEAMVNTGLVQLGRLSTGRINLTDTAYSIAGAAPDVPTYDQVVAELRSMPSGFTLASQDITGPTARPFAMTMAKAANGITLTGAVPSQATRNAIVAAAQAATPGTVTDQMTLALGAPAGFEAAAVRGAGLLQRLTGGTYTQSDTTYSLVGVAVDPPTATSVATAAAAPPQGFTAGRIEVTSPTVSPYSWTADWAGSRIALSGFIPDEPARERILARTRQLFPTIGIDDQMRLAAGAPAVFPQITDLGIDLLARLKTGRADVSDTLLRISGEAPTFDVATAIRAALAAAPSPIRGEHNLTLSPAEMPAPIEPAPVFVPPPPPPPPAPVVVQPPPPPPPAPVATGPNPCQLLVDKARGDEFVLFDTGRDIVKRQYFGVLDRIAKAFRTCPPEYRMELVGRADLRADPDYNIDLSRRRAEAVLEYLARRGRVDRGRMSVKALGESTPIGQDISPAGLRLNRRVDFVVIR